METMKKLRFNGAIRDQRMVGQEPGWRNDREEVRVRIASGEGRPDRTERPLICPRELSPVEYVVMRLLETAPGSEAGRRILDGARAEGWIGHA